MITRKNIFKLLIFNVKDLHVGAGTRTGTRKKGLHTVMKYISSPLVLE